MDDTYKGNGGFNLTRLSLIHTDDVGAEYEIDLTRAYVDVSLFETVFDLTMSGNVAVLDSVNLRDLVRLYGNERIEIEFHTLGAEEFPIVYTGSVYKLEQSVRVSEHAKGYVIHFCSPEMVTNLRTFTQQAFKDTNSTVVQKIFRNRLKTSDKPLQATNTQGIKGYVFGTVSPLAAISRNCKDAISSTGDVGYLFYEDNKAFNFRPIQELYQQEPVTEYVYRNAGIYQDVKQRAVEQFNAIQGIEVIEDGSFLDRVSEGQHGSTWMFYDLIKKDVIEVKYNKDEAFDGNRSLGNLSTKRDVSNPNYNDLWVFNAISDTTGIDRSPNAIMTKAFIENSKMRILVFGDSSLKCGDTCLATVPNWSGGEDSESLLTGKFLIAELKHVINADKYMQVITLTKDSYEDIDA